MHSVARHSENSFPLIVMHSNCHYSGDVYKRVLSFVLHEVTCGKVEILKTVYKPFFNCDRRGLCG